MTEGITLADRRIVLLEISGEMPTHFCVPLCSMTMTVTNNLAKEICEGMHSATESSKVI